MDAVLLYIDETEIFKCNYYKFMFLLKVDRSTMRIFYINVSDKQYTVYINWQFL